MSRAPEFSVVVPILNEAENVPLLVQSIRDALGDREAWELVLVDDGSTDETPEIASGLARNDYRVRLLRLARNYGQTAAMQAGFDAARGAAVVSMDGDLQNDPRDIPMLMDKLREGFDLVVGYRQRRQDKLFTRRVPSWVANRLIRWLTGVRIRDNGCSLKAYRRELVTRLALYSDQHRFIPAMAVGTAGARVAEVPVRHHARRHGHSKYGLSRIAKVLADLFTISAIRSFREHPFRLYAFAALAACGVGALYAAAGLVAAASFSQLKAEALVFPASGLLWFGLGFYLAMLGLMGEIALRSRRRKHAERPPLLLTNDVDDRQRTATP